MRAHLTYMSHFGTNITYVGSPTAMHDLEAEVLTSDRAQNHRARASQSNKFYYVKLILNHYLVS
jgi:hypothetical protein